MNTIYHQVKIKNFVQLMQGFDNNVYVFHRIDDQLSNMYYHALICQVIIKNQMYYLWQMYLLLHTCYRVRIVEKNMAFYYKTLKYILYEIGIEKLIFSTIKISNDPLMNIYTLERYEF